MHDPWMDRLSEYLDEELERSERERLEEHLTQCPDCRSVLADLKAVRARARGLTKAPVPPAARLRTTGPTQVNPRGGGPPMTAAAPAGRTDVEAVSAQRAPESPHEEAISELRKALAKERDRLDPATIRTLESNLAIIDLAIDQAKRADGRRIEAKIGRAHV